MKISRFFRLGLVGSVALFWALAAPGSTVAQETKQATITQIVNDVQLRGTQTDPRAAALNDKVSDGSSVRTGMNSRTELLFTDQALARLSANTNFNFNDGARDLDLTSGAVLLQIPKGVHGAKISIGGITAAVAGTTVIVEYYPHTYLKFISLAGTARLYLKHRWGESVLVRPGQILITNPDAKGLPDPVDVDLARLLSTSRLIVDFPPLASQKLIAKESEKQQRAKSKRGLIDTNLVIFGKGTLVSLTNPAQMKNATSQPSASSVTRSDEVPSSTDLGTIETPPNPPPTSTESAETNYSGEDSR